MPEEAQDASMACVSAFDYEISLETKRLLLRPWHVSEAEIRRRLWAERDPRVPPSRRIAADGTPSVEDLAAEIRQQGVPDTLGLLAIERHEDGGVIGYAGLIEGRGPVGQPELAYELLRDSWGQGYATEACWAVLGWAKQSGFRWVWATVSEWNGASLRVLEKLGFRSTGRVEPGSDHADTLFFRKRV